MKTQIIRKTERDIEKKVKEMSNSCTNWGHESEDEQGGLEFDFSEDETHETLLGFVKWLIEEK